MMPRLENHDVGLCAPDVAGPSVVRRVRAVDEGARVQLIRQQRAVNQLVPGGVGRYRIVRIVERNLYVGGRVAEQPVEIRRVRRGGRRRRAAVEANHTPSSWTCSASLRLTEPGRARRTRRTPRCRRCSTSRPPANHRGRRLGATGYRQCSRGTGAPREGRQRCAWGCRASRSPSPGRGCASGVASTYRSRRCRRSPHRHSRPG